VNGLEGFLHIRRVETDEWVLSHFGAVNGFDLDFVDGALAAFFFLRERESRQDGACQQQQYENE
jgi:hypothetical protein